MKKDARRRRRRMKRKRAASRRLLDVLVEDADHHAAAQVGDVLLGEVWVDGVREVVGAECREDAAVVAILLAWRVRGGLDLPAGVVEGFLLLVPALAVQILPRRAQVPNMSMW